MTITISSGTAYAGINISSGNPLVVLAGGSLEFSNVLSGGSATFSSGGGAVYLTVDKGGLVQGTGEMGGSVEVFGTLDGMTLEAPGYLEIYSGGTASGVTVSGPIGSAYIQVESGASITNTELVQGIEVIYSGGVASGDTVQSGSQLFLDGGTASQESVLSGGLFVLGGNLTSNLTLISGAQSSAHVLSGVEVLSGASIAIIGANVESGVTLTASSGAEIVGLSVAKGGALVGTAILSGLVEVAGSARGVTIGSGGDVLVSSGGIASGLIGLSGSTIEVDAGGSATGTVLSSGGSLFDFGSATGAVVSSGGLARIYGVTVGDIVSSGGKEIVSSGASASGVKVLGGGLEYVLAAGAATGLLVSSGGKELLSSGGVTNATNVSSGGAAYVYSGSLDKRGVVSSGGAEEILSGGVASDLSLILGGRLTDDGRVQVAGAGTMAGDLAGSGTLIETGGGDLVLNDGGAGFTGSAVIEGGIIEFGRAGVIGTGTVTFVAPATGSAVLQIDAGAAPAAGGAFSNVISNFNAANEDIDLTSIAFVAGASATVVGTALVLHDGGNTYTFNLAGGAAGAYPVLSDGHGGTLIDPKAIAPKAVDPKTVDPKAIDPKAVAFAQAAASFEPPGAANLSLVIAGSPNALTPFAYSIGSGHY